MRTTGNTNKTKAHPRQVARALKGFRLLAAGAILGNRLNTKDLSTDTADQYELAELCDQYAIALLFEWLAKHLVITGYADGISAEFLPSVAELFSFLKQCDAYPFAHYQPSPSALAELMWQAEPILEQVSADLELIGSLYEHIVNSPIFISPDGLPQIQVTDKSKDKRRPVGQFYTPPHIVRYCLERAWQTHSMILMNELKYPQKALICEVADQSLKADGLPKLLDPACGSGNFLVGAAKLIWEQSRSIDVLERFLLEFCYGIELDGRAAALARAALVLQFFAAGLAAQAPAKTLLCKAKSIYQSLLGHVAVSDSVYAATANRLSAASNHFLPPHWHLNPDQFDVLVTNPPYISYGARNQPDLLPSQASFLRASYPDTSEYKIRLHSIFQEICLRYCKPEGTAVLLVPDGFLGGSFYGRLRNHLLRNSTIASLTELPDDTIYGAVVGRWCVAHYVKSSQPRPADFAVTVVRLDKSGGNWHRHVLPLSVLVCKEKNRFRLLFNGADEEIVTRCDGLPCLRAKLRGHTGIRSRIGQSRIVSDRSHGRPWSRGIRSGKAVSPFSVSWDQSWIQLDEQLLFSGGFDREIVMPPKIMVRQTADRLIAAVDTTGLFHLNNVHSFSPHGTMTTCCENQLHFLTALMNSTFWLYLYQLQTREAGRALAQIDIETVESLPLPEIDGSAELTQLSLHCVQAAQQQDRNNFDFARRSIDKLVYDLYELPDRLIEHIERACMLKNGLMALPSLKEIQDFLENGSSQCRLI